MLISAQKEKILATGAGGFIGHHLVKFLKKKGCWVRGVDIKYPEFSPADQADEFLLLDLRSFKNCLKAVQGMDKVYTLAANMGGIGFITTVQAEVMRDNALININMAQAARLSKVKKIFFSSSVCVYPVFKLQVPEPRPLKEDDVFPAFPNEGYGWEKLFSEMVYQGFARDHGLEIRIARYDNTYGPESAFEGGKEKAPAAICRKVALAKDGDEIEIWGDGKQTRTFLYIEDNLEATYRLMESDFRNPVNIASQRLVTIDELVDLVAGVTGKKLKKIYRKDKPQGVRGRIVDAGLAEKILGWTPKVSLEEGMERTYYWVERELKKQGRI